jgi:hypothetical protein
MIGFIEILQNVTTHNCYSLTTEINTPKITVTAEHIIISAPHIHLAAGLHVTIS